LIMHAFIDLLTELSPMDPRSSHGVRPVNRMDNETIKRRLFAAVHALAYDEGTVDVRLRKVYEGELRLVAGLTLPSKIRRDYELLMADLVQLLEGQSNVDLRRASLLAQRVVTLYERIVDEL